MCKYSKKEVMLISKALKLRIETTVRCEHRLLLTQKEVTGNMKLADLTVNCANGTLQPDPNCSNVGNFKELISRDDRIGGEPHKSQGAKRTFVKMIMNIWPVDKMIGSICGQLDGRGGGDGELIMNAQRIQQNAS